MAGEQERVRAEWQAVAGGWRRWEALLQAFTWPVALRMASVAHIGESQRVLDVGCGIGDPTLQIAVLVGPHGRVVGIDLVEDMLATARERAAALGLAHVEFRAADVSQTELTAGGFDAVLGRWSLIYVADVPQALARLRAALVPGGRIALAAWAPPEVNPWITIPMTELGKVRALPTPESSAPGIFHLSADGALAGGLVAAGFRNVSQERVQLSHFTHGAAEFWAMMSDTAGPLAPLLSGLGTADRERVQRGIEEQLRPYRVGDVLRIPGQAQLAWGQV